jgi:hypothetical protein
MSVTLLVVAAPAALAAILFWAACVLAKRADSAFVNDAAPASPTTVL